MVLDYAMLADGVGGRPDGKVDIYGASWDTIFASAVPATHPQLSLVARVLVSPHELVQPHRIEVLLQAADGQELARASGEVNPATPEQRAQIPVGHQAGLPFVLSFQNVRFPAYGSYQLVLTWDGTDMRDPLRLFVEPLPAQG